MTWKEFKEQVEKEGVKDADKIHNIDCYMKEADDIHPSFWEDKGGWYIS
jgi:hypothetical protein